MDKRYSQADAHEQLERRRQVLRSIHERPGLPLSEVIKTLRKELRLTLQEYSALTGISPRVIHGIEHGTGNPTLSTAEKLLKPFGLRLGVV
ncbi:hypothetical protein A6D6_00341 [Alcanivorax xiamenensis]|uniref:HTH cro/C1-type domain-containing protein n=1 Tax=Alcanivorax xiamenensis TaxID=1177156 RepID=A0ABQ6YCK1_9GAMM|nr:helix-turn-helix transcriptional regulator [Alcanivorax xiamenensis]KAF0807951.1 hypothetical protein A6D6_00341 [Alcanivorax xiamenensis]